MPEVSRDQLVDLQSKNKPCKQENKNVYIFCHSGMTRSLTYLRKIPRVKLYFRFACEIAYLAASGKISLFRCFYVSVCVFRGYFSV